MVFVKVRETYDLHTTKDKMTVIGIHTPKPDIIKRNYPGLLMQCKMYRPYSCDVRIACASMLPLDPQGIGTSPGDVAPEDIFNPILYKAMSNKGMSQLEARINGITQASIGLDVDGDSAAVEVDSFTSQTDEFNVYYGLLSDTNSWRHASPQSGLEMKGLRPYVYEILYNVGDSNAQRVDSNNMQYAYPDRDGNVSYNSQYKIIGAGKPMPFINCTTYTLTGVTAKDADPKAISGYAKPGFTTDISNSCIGVPWLEVVVGAIIVPPSKLHELFYRMVVEWTIEFSSIRSLSELTGFTDLALLGNATHYQNYSYSSTKEAITGSSESIMENDTCMVSTNADIKKVM